MSFLSKESISCSPDKVNDESFLIRIFWQFSFSLFSQFLSDFEPKTGVQGSSYNIFKVLPKSLSGNSLMLC